MMKSSLILSLLFMFSLSYGNMNNNVEYLYYNATVYTIDQGFTVTEAFVVDNGILLASGKYEALKAAYTARYEIDLEGKYVYPGFIDAHCHFMGYGIGLISSADLRGTKSAEEIVERLQVFHEDNPSAIIQGRGWDQNDWQVNEFPDKSILDAAFPDIPVMLTRVDGHAMWVNSLVLKKAGLTKETKVEGGEVHQKNGELTGILIDNAMGLVKKIVTEPSLAAQKNALLRAQQNCFATGLTSVGDAGLDKSEVLLMDSLHKSGDLKMNVYAMLNPNEENFDFFVRQGVYMTDKLNVRSIKLYADGALGSRGAMLLEPYTDDPENTGLQVYSQTFYREVCKLAFDHNYQVNVHAIGDAAVRMTLDIFTNYLEGADERRWRIEHAQVVHPDDMQRFGHLGVIPSIQATHATSDMYWAIERLGEDRIGHAYAYRELMEQNGWIPNGTDFPVEKINPFYTFFASVARKDQAGWPEQGFQPENALSREETLRSMTIWAAKSFFEEDRRGSLEAGKVADFIVLDKDIMTIDEMEIPKLKVVSTYVAGEQVYNSNNKNH